MRRSSKAICANLAEGFAKQPHSKAEFARFISMAMGSCSEVETWISYASDLEYISKTQLDRWQQFYSQIYGMLVNLRAALKRPLSPTLQFSSSSIPLFPRLRRVLAVFPPRVRANCGLKPNSCGRAAKPNINRVS
ncbi:four helix bundle protein [Mesorhizobium opportunistum]|uniref:Four helix bundle protein n=1 Tax=Mesorhizobium opportunistum TaxID=593909 RepID=A0ABV1YC93_9HYPH|nr:four helix bundle protein [Mesorhizobium sp.]